MAIGHKPSVRCWSVLHRSNLGLGLFTQSLRNVRLNNHGDMGHILSWIWWICMWTRLEWGFLTDLRVPPDWYFKQAWVWWDFARNFHRLTSLEGILSKICKAWKACDLLSVRESIHIQSWTAHSPAATSKCSSSDTVLPWKSHRISLRQQLTAALHLCRCGWQAQQVAECPSSGATNAPIVGPQVSPQSWNHGGDQAGNPQFWDTYQNFRLVKVQNKRSNAIKIDQMQLEDPTMWRKMRMFENAIKCHLNIAKTGISNNIQQLYVERTGKRWNKDNNDLGPRVLLSFCSWKRFSGAPAAQRFPTLPIASSMGLCTNRLSSAKWTPQNKHEISTNYGLVNFMSLYPPMNKNNRISKLPGLLINHTFGWVSTSALSPGRATIICCIAASLPSSRKSAAFLALSWKPGQQAHHFFRCLQWWTIECNTNGYNVYI